MRIGGSRRNHEPVRGVIQATQIERDIKRLPGIAENVKLGTLEGFDTAEAYSKNAPYFGAIVGRVANRIGNAAFTLEVPSGAWADLVDRRLLRVQQLELRAGLLGQPGRGNARHVPRRGSGTALER